MKPEDEASMGGISSELEAIANIVQSLECRSKSEQARILAYVVARTFPDKPGISESLYATARDARGAR